MLLGLGAPSTFYSWGWCCFVEINLCIHCKFCRPLFEWISENLTDGDHNPTAVGWTLLIAGTSCLMSFLCRSYSMLNIKDTIKNTWIHHTKYTISKTKHTNTILIPKYHKSWMISRTSCLISFLSSILLAWMDRRRSSLLGIVDPGDAGEVMT